MTLSNYITIPIVVPPPPPPNKNQKTKTPTTAMTYKPCRDVLFKSYGSYSLSSTESPSRSLGSRLEILFPARYLNKGKQKSKI